MYGGIDWAEDHHDIALADRDGQLLARRRISDDATGLAGLLALLAEHGDTPDDLIPVAIETPRGLLVACRRATGRRVCPINPMAVARYRDRHFIAGRKSGHGGSVVLASVLRTDQHAHRPLPAGTELAQVIAVLARAQQDAVWDRTTAHNNLRSHLREYFPGFLAAFAPVKGGILRPEARAVLAAAPTPADAAKLTLTQLRALLNKAGRRRGIDTEATGCAMASAPSRCASSPSSNKPWAGKPWPCSASSTPPAPPPPTSRAPPPSLLACTRTPGSSPASQGSAH